MNQIKFIHFYLLKNLILNAIIKEIQIYNENEVSPKSLNNYYIDVLLDISQMMIDDQKIASLIINTGLSISFSIYRIK